MKMNETQPFVEKTSQWILIFKWNMSGMETQLSLFFFHIDFQKLHPENKIDFNREWETRLLK